MKSGELILVRYYCANCCVKKFLTQRYSVLVPICTVPVHIEDKLIKFNARTNLYLNRTILIWNNSR